MTRGVRRAVSLRLDGGRGEIVVCEPRADGQSGAGHRGGLLTLLAAPPAPGSSRCPLGDPTACGILQYPQRVNPAHSRCSLSTLTAYT